VFGITPAADGKGLDETAIQAEILDQLTQPGAAADLRVDGAFVAAAPQVSDEDAQNAIFEAEKMIEDVNVTWSTPPPSAPANLDSPDVDHRRLSDPRLDRLRNATGRDVWAGRRSSKGAGLSFERHRE